MVKHSAAISIAIAGLMLVACGASDTASADRPLAVFVPKSTVTTQTFVVRNVGATSLPPLILMQEGGARYEIPELASGQSREVPFQIDLALRDIILVDVRSGAEYGVQGALGVDSPRIMYGDSLLTVSAGDGKLTGWVRPLEFPKNLPGGAGRPLYDLAAREPSAVE